MFFAVTSVFVAAPLVNFAAIHAWWTRRRVATKSVLAAVGYDLVVGLAFFLLRNRTNERVQADFGAGFMWTDSIESS